MTKTIEDLFVYLRLSTDVVIILLFLYLIRRSKLSRAFPLILIYCCIDLIFNIVVERFPFSQRFTEVAYTAYTLIEYFIFTAFIFINLRNRIVKKLMIWLSVAFTVFMVSYTLTTENQNIDSIPIGVETILILLYAFYFFYEEMNNLEQLFIYSKPEFWIITGFMIYLAGSFFIYVFANQVDYSILLKYWFLTNVFFIMQTLLFAIGLIMFLRQNKRNQGPKQFHPYLN